MKLTIFFLQSPSSFGSGLGGTSCVGQGPFIFGLQEGRPVKQDKLVEIVGRAGVWCTVVRC